jgi:predicted Holliday junction resolvase-like endonuclease
METTMFALGVLTMIMVILITVVVIGIVKVFRMSQQIKNLYSYISDTDRHLNDRCAEIERSSDSRFCSVEDHFHRNVNDQITDAVTQSASYTDKRIDKLIDTYFMVKEAEETNKKLIKG